MKIERELARSMNVHHIKLSKESRKILNKIKDKFGGRVSDHIEYSNWYFPFNSCVYSKIRNNLVKMIRQTYNVPDDVDIHIKSFEAGILSFEDGIYPEY